MTISLPDFLYWFTAVLEMLFSLFFIILV